MWTLQTSINQKDIHKYLLAFTDTTVELVNQYSKREAETLSHTVLFRHSAHEFFSVKITGTEEKKLKNVPNNLHNHKNHKLEVHSEEGNSLSSRQM